LSFLSPYIFYGVKDNVKNRTGNKSKRNKAENGRAVAGGKVFFEQDRHFTQQGAKKMFHRRAIYNRIQQNLCSDERRLKIQYLTARLLLYWGGLYPIAGLTRDRWWKNYPAKLFTYS
jgi:hypothetical protein